MAIHPNRRRLARGADGHLARLIPCVWFAARLMPRGSLPRRETELVILRVAHLRGCDYELRQHTRPARRAGLSKNDVQQVVTSDGPGPNGRSGRERAMLTAVDRLHHHRDLDDATWTLLRAHLTEPACIELCMLAAHYDMLATVIAASRIRPDPPRRLPPRGLLPRGRGRG